MLLHFFRISFCSLAPETSPGGYFLYSCLCVNRGLAFTVCAHFPFPCCSGLLSHFSFCGMWSLGFYARGEAEGLGSHSLCGLFAAFCVSLCLFLVLFPVGLSGLLGWFGLLCAFQVPLHNVLGRFFTCDCFPLLRVSGLTCGNGRTSLGSCWFTSSEGDVVFGSLLVCVVSCLLSLDFLLSFCVWFPVSRSLVVEFDFPGCLVPCCSWRFSSDLAWCSALAPFFLYTVRCGPLLHGTFPVSSTFTLPSPSVMWMLCFLD